MENNDKLRALYIESYDKIHAPDGLLKKVKNMRGEKTNGRRAVAMRRVLIAAAVSIAVFVMSNAAVFAATGETWVEKLFWYDERPVQPMENVRNFFNGNAEVLGESGGSSAAHNYYGGTYLDGGTQVILLTDLSKISEFADVPQGVRFEKCDYTYDELTDEIKSINEKLDRFRAQNQGYAADVVAWGLHDMENRLFVDIYQLNDDKVQWFRDNVSDRPYLVFVNADSFPQDGLD